MIAGHLARWLAVRPSLQATSQIQIKFWLWFKVIFHPFSTSVLETGALVRYNEHSFIPSSAVHDITQWKSRREMRRHMTCNAGSCTCVKYVIRAKDPCRCCYMLTCLNSSVCTVCKHTSVHTQVVDCSGVKLFENKTGRERKILLHPTLPFSFNELVYLGHIMFGLTAVPVTGSVLPACSLWRSMQKTHSPPLAN